MAVSLRVESRQTAASARSLFSLGMMPKPVGERGQGRRDGS